MLGSAALRHSRQVVAAAFLAVVFVVVVIVLGDGSPASRASLVALLAPRAVEGPVPSGISARIPPQILSS